MCPRMLMAGALLASSLGAQTECPETPIYSPCEIVFELDEQEAAKHPNPYLSVQLHGEFRSPGHQTFLMNAFWDGGRRMVIRFTPTEPGRWDYRFTSSIQRFNGKTGQLTAAAAPDVKGFVRVANFRHFSYTETKVRPIPHLWMGDTMYRFAGMDRALFEKMVDARAGQKFNHIRGLVIRDGEDKTAYPNPDQPNPEYFRELDQRILYMNRAGITADLVLAGDENHLVKVFPGRQQRESYVRYLVSRYSPMNITWQGVQEFEEYDESRAILKEVGELLKKLDPYQHPRSTHTVATSSPLLADGWMDYIVYQSSENALGAIEHQLFTVPQVNAEFAYEDSGAGKSHAHHVDTETFRKRLWNAAMNGQYPTYGNTGAYGGRKFDPDAKYLQAAGAEQMTHWYNFFSNTRHWELEPFFEVDGGRALALTGVEYIVYLEKPGPVELVTEKKSYEVYWFNPITGESIKQKKDYKGERFSGQPPDLTHDWVLHLSRDDHKKGMLESWYFESRRVPVQEVELNLKRVPYEIVEPAGGDLSAGKPIPYSAKIVRETRATSGLLFLWLGEFAAGEQGYRVLGTGLSGNMTISPKLARNWPATLTMRVLGMNTYGKVYSLNRVFQVTR